MNVKGFVRCLTAILVVIFCIIQQAAKIENKSIYYNDHRDLERYIKYLKQMRLRMDLKTLDTINKKGVLFLCLNIQSNASLFYYEIDNHNLLSKQFVLLNRNGIGNGLLKEQWLRCLTLNWISDNPFIRIYGIFSCIIALTFFVFVDKPWTMDERPGGDNVFVSENGQYKINPYPLLLRKDGTFKLWVRILIVGWFLFMGIVVPSITGSGP